MLLHSVLHYLNKFKMYTFDLLNKMYFRPNLLANNKRNITALLLDLLPV